MTFLHQGNGRNNAKPGDQHFQSNPSTSATAIVTSVRSHSFSNALRKGLKNPSGKYDTLYIIKNKVCNESNVE